MSEAFPEPLLTSVEVIDLPNREASPDDQQFLAPASATLGMTVA